MELLKSIHRRLLPDIPGVGWTPYLWLVYVSFFFIRYFYVTPGALELAGIVVTMALFLALYFNGYWKKGRALLPNITVIALLGLIWAPVNPGAGVFIIYAASFAAWVGPVRRAVVTVAVIILAAMVVAAFWQTNPVYWMPALVFGSIVAVVNMYYAEQTRRDGALRLSQEEVRQLARVAERERISRDLHDLLGHTLSVITLKSELASRLIDRDPQRAATEIREVESVSRAALAQVREAVAGFRTRGLAGELEQAHLALKSAAVTLEVDGKPDNLSPAHEVVFAMVLREVVTNVIRHAQANVCRVMFRVEGGETCMEIHDDGRGGSLAGDGSGIEGMRNRLTAAGGRLEISDHYGARIRAWLPL